MPLAKGPSKKTQLVNKNPKNTPKNQLKIPVYKLKLFSPVNNFSGYPNFFLNSTKSVKNTADQPAKAIPIKPKNDWNILKKLSLINNTYIPKVNIMITWILIAVKLFTFIFKVDKFTLAERKLITDGATKPTNAVIK